MTKNTWMSAPAGVLGQGAADVRALVAVVPSRRPLAVLQGSGLPATPVRGRGVDHRPAGPAHTGGAPTSSPAIESICTPRGEFTAQFDGTTLGFHPSSRPLS